MFNPNGCGHAAQRAGSVCGLECISPSLLHVGVHQAVCSAQGEWKLERPLPDVGACFSSCKPLVLTHYASVTPLICGTNYISPGKSYFTVFILHMDVSLWVACFVFSQ